MSTDLSKLCSDYLRANFSTTSVQKFKASHSRELVAAFFGYKSHAALISEKNYPVNDLEEAHIFIPNIPLMESRRLKLTGLPNYLPPSKLIAEALSSFLTEEKYIGANIWLYDTLESYIADVLLIDCQSMIDDELSGVMAETNASFFDQPYYEIDKIQEHNDELVITAKADYKGEPLDDKPFCGDTINLSVQIILPRIAGKRGFYDFELTVGGGVNDDWVDPELKHGALRITKPKSSLAIELGISDDDLEQLDWDTQENCSNDGLIYDYILTFYEHNPPEILEKIDGMDKNMTIRVSVNAFDEPPNPFGS